MQRRPAPPVARPCGVTPLSWVWNALVSGAAFLVVAPQASGQNPASYTSNQAGAGESAFRDVCASCHMRDLTGGSDTPALVGSNFRSMWRGRQVSELFNYVKAAMPPAGRKPDDETLIAVVAYILHENDVPSGDTPLAATTEGNIVWPPANR